MKVLRDAAVAVAAGAVLGLAQVAVAEWAAVLTLGADFGGGDDRVQGVQVTLVAWYSATAVPTATWLAGARRGRGPVTVLAAAAGAFAAYPLVTALSGDGIRGAAGFAVVIGVLLGVVGGAAVAAAPVVGRGMAAYAALLWAAALVLTPLVSGTVVYAGLVQPLGLDLASWWGSTLRSLSFNLAYHLPTMVPVAVLILVLAAVVGGVAARRTGAWTASVAAGALGPVLSALLYRLLPDQDYLWNESAGAVTSALAAGCVLLTGATAAFGRHLHRRDVDPA